MTHFIKSETGTSLFLLLLRPEGQFRHFESSIKIAIYNLGREKHWVAGANLRDLGRERLSGMLTNVRDSWGVKARIFEARIGEQILGP
jgi:hypothetical protein